METKAWYEKPATIIGLLVLFPPAGILLTWFVATWNQKTKTIASVASAAWLAFALINARREKVEKAQPSKTTTATAANAGTREPSVPPSAPIITPITDTAAQDAPGLPEKEPRLLVPIKVEGFLFWTADTHPACCGVTAVYMGKPNQSLVAKVHIRTEPNEELPEPDKVHRAVDVSGHPAITYDADDENRITVMWFVGKWMFVSNVLFERPRDRRAAKQAALKLAPLVASHADRYLLAVTPPDKAEQAEHISFVERANADTARRNEKHRIEDGPHEFVAKLKKAGIGGDLIASVVRGELNGEELVIKVANAWHGVHKQERLQAAQNLWKLWAGINTPQEPDKSRISLVDLNGNEVGGSRVWAGSTIWVK